MQTPDKVEARINVYETKRGLQADSSLGVGTQGTVLLFDNPSQTASLAVKFHERKIAYDRELSIYVRLQDLDIEEVCGHAVPQLLGNDDDLLAIEMTTVSPPFVLDFGGAYLDRPPDYSPEVWDDWRQQKSEAFEDNWSAVEEILSEFASMGIHIADVNPGNIRF